MTFAEALEATEDLSVLTFKKEANSSSYDSSNLYKIMGTVDKDFIAVSLADNQKIKIPTSLLNKERGGFYYSRYLIDKSMKRTSLKDSFKTLMSFVKKTVKYVFDYDPKEKKVNGYISYTPFGKSEVTIAELFIGNGKSKEDVGSNLIKCVESTVKSQGFKYLSWEAGAGNSTVISMCNKYGFKKLRDEKLV